MPARTMGRHPGNTSPLYSTKSAVPSQIALDSLTVSVAADPENVYIDHLMSLPGSEWQLRRGFSGIQVKTFSASGIALGISRVQYTLEIGRVVISLNAKALGRLYRRGITLETLLPLIQALCSTGVVHLTVDQLRKALVLRADAVVNVPVDPELIPGYVGALGVLRGGRGFVYERYSRTSVAFRNSGRQRDTRLAAYGKAAELQKPDNADLRQALGQEGCAAFDNVLRLERQARTFKAVRALGDGLKGEVELGQLLASTTTPVSDLLAHLIEQLPAAADLVDAYELISRGEGYQDVLKDFGRRSIARDCKGDTQCVRDLLRFADRSNNRDRWFKDFKPVLRAMAAQDAGITDEEASGLLADLLERVRVAERA
jgi:hypothetical protein